MERLLILEDGTVFEGKAFGADASVFGEKVLTVKSLHLPILWWVIMG